MRPGGDDERIRMALEGLERMARLCRSRRAGGGGSSLLGLARAIRRRTPGELLRMRAIRRSGVDRPLNRPANAAAERWMRDPGRYFSESRIVVYTACFGGYDRVNDPVLRPDNIDYRWITDRPECARGTAWGVLPAEGLVPAEYAGDPVLANRWCKLHPHALFPEYALSVYIDSNLLVVSDLTALTRALADYPVAMFLHKNRDCVYEEIRACLLKGKDTRAALTGQEARLRARGVPERYGLLEAPVIARRHMDARCIELMDAWWSAYLAGSRRDQIALIDALWQLGIRPETLGTLGNNVAECDLFLFMPHAGDRK